MPYKKVKDNQSNSESNSNIHKSTNTSIDDSIASVSSGLFVSGVIIDRIRRGIPQYHPKVEVVTYIIADDNHHKHYVEDYSPESYYEKGEKVTFSVYVKPYAKKNNELSYNLCIQKAFYQPAFGERF